MGLTFPGLRYVFFDIPMQREALTNVLYVAIMGHADPWIFSVFQHRLRREQYRPPVRLVSLQRCAELRFVLLSEVL